MSKILKLLIIHPFFLFCFATHPLCGKDFCMMEHALVSIYAVDCESGKVLIDQNSDLSLVPASSLKIVTTSAALQLLGPNYRFETHLEYDGHNLYIRGEGDPSLGSERFGSSWNKQIETWADAIQRKGIQTIKGKVIGDAARWEKAQAAPSWAWEDLGNYYGAGASALSFHENSYSLFFKPAGRVGEKASILRTDPPDLKLELQNEVTTGPEGSGDRACIFGSEYSPLAFVRGTIPAGVDEFAIKGAIPDPAAYCADLLTQELQRRGVLIENEVMSQINQRKVFHTTHSPPLKEIVYWTNQKSINLYAEHLLKKMGEVAYHEGSTSSGVKAISDFLHSQAIEDTHIVDGSGLSRKNLITTKQLVQVLLHMKKTEFFPVFFESLPQINEKIRAKSGTMSLIHGSVGYAGTIAFAILINNCPDSRLMHEKIQIFLEDLSHALPEKNF